MGCSKGVVLGGWERRVRGKDGGGDLLIYIHTHTHTRSTSRKRAEDRKTLSGMKNISNSIETQRHRIPRRGCLSLDVFGSKHIYLFFSFLFFSLSQSPWMCRRVRGMKKVDGCDEVCGYVVYTYIRQHIN